MFNVILFYALTMNIAHATVLDKIPVVLVDSEEQEKVENVPAFSLSNHLSQLVNKAESEIIPLHSESKLEKSHLHLKRIRMNINVLGKIGLGPIIGLELYTRQSLFWTKK